MATVYSSWVGGDDWRVKMDYSVSNSSNTTATVTITASVQSQYGYTKNTGCRVVFACGSQSYTANISHALPSWTTFTLGSHSFSVSRTTSTQNVGISAHVSWPNTSVSAYRPGVRASSSVSISARPSYTISYNANGGTGAPGNQTKWYGTNLVLSSTKPTRTGYTFKNWSTDFGSGNVYFEPGGTYTYNSAAVLYANWTANTWTVSYDANGGEGAPESQTKTYGETLVLSSVAPTRTNYNFKGWAISSTGSVVYQPGGDYTDNAAVTLYAVWEIAYIAPIITNVAVDRCDSAGTLADDGTRLKVSFNYQLDETYSGGMDYIQLGYKLSSASEYTNLSTYTTTEMSGPFSQVIGGGLVETEYAYDVQIIVKDHKGSTTLTRSVGPLAYIIDFSPAGGVSLGKPAPEAKTFEVAIDSMFAGETTLSDTTFNSGFTTNGDARFLTDTGILASNGSKLINVSSEPRLQFTEHTQLANGKWLQGGLSSGDFTDMLRMSEDDRVELNWTQGGLSGRVMKLLWEGSWTSGSITVPELPYYNAFCATLSNADPNEWQGIGFTHGTSLSLVSHSIAGTSWIICQVIAKVSGSTLTYSYGKTHVYRTDTGAASMVQISRVRAIYGLL